MSPRRKEDKTPYRLLAQLYPNGVGTEPITGSFTDVGAARRAARYELSKGQYKFISILYANGDIKETVDCTGASR